MRESAAIKTKPSRQEPQHTRHTHHSGHLVAQNGARRGGVGNKPIRLEVRTPQRQATVSGQVSGSGSGSGSRRNEQRRSRVEAMGSGSGSSSVCRPRVVAGVDGQARSGRRWEMRLMRKGSCFRHAARREFDMEDPGEVVRLRGRRASRLAVRTEDASTTATTSRQQFGSAEPPPPCCPAQSRTEEGGARQNGRPPMASPYAVSRIQPSWAGSFLAIPCWPISPRPAPALVPRLQAPGTCPGGHTSPSVCSPRLTNSAWGCARIC